jgi:uncharacterized integral membrane protein
VTSPPPSASSVQHEVPRTRAGGAWKGIAVGLLVVLLMLVFILQNLQRTKLNILWMHLRTPVGVGLLLAAVLGGMVVLFLGGFRMLQLRKAVKSSNYEDALRSGS